MMRLFYPEKRVRFIREFYVPASSFPGSQSISSILIMTEFSRAEIDLFIKAFKAFDLDGSGAIDAGELETALQVRYYRKNI